MVGWHGSIVKWIPEGREGVFLGRIDGYLEEDNKGYERSHEGMNFETRMGWRFNSLFFLYCVWLNDEKCICLIKCEFLGCSKNGMDSLQADYFLLSGMEQTIHIGLTFTHWEYMSDITTDIG